MNAQLKLIDNPPAPLMANPGVEPSARALAAPESWQPGTGVGLLLPVDAEPEPRYADAELIAIDFPAFHDGRGLSLAVLLRTRLNFTGELRAVGEVHPDLLHYMRRCGFDSYQLRAGDGAADRSGGSPAESPAESSAESSAESALAPYSDYYQASVVEPRPAYRRVRRGA